MKTSQINNIPYFSRLVQLEYQVNNRLSQLLFGPAGDADYKDIPLPSEQRKKSDLPKSKTKSRKRKRSLQLHLLLSKKVKIAMYDFIEKIEGRYNRKTRTEQLNSYR